MKEHEKLGQKLVSKVTLHFVSGHLLKNNIKALKSVEDHFNVSPVFIRRFTKRSFNIQLRYSIHFNSTQHEPKSRNSLKYFKFVMFKHFERDSIHVFSYTVLYLKSL